MKWQHDRVFKRVIDLRAMSRPTAREPQLGEQASNPNDEFREDRLVDMMLPNIPDVSSAAQHEIVEGHSQTHTRQEWSQSFREGPEGEHRRRWKGEGQVPEIVVWEVTKDLFGCGFFRSSLRAATDTQGGYAAGALRGEPKIREEKTQEGA